MNVEPVEPPQPSPLSSDQVQELRRRVHDGMPAVLAQLQALARIPSVSLESFGPEPVRDSAAEVARLFGDLGMTVEVVAEGGHPAVIAQLPGPAGAPTVLLYAHHDVQPPGDPDEWHSDPFVPVERDGRLYGRGVADDKAGVMAHVAAIRTLLADGPLPVGVTVFVEGEEEVGSESLPALLSRHADRLRCDAIVLADSTNWAVGQPALTTSLRGNIRVVLTLSALTHGVHSGMYGGAAPDALTAMCRLLATFHDEVGDVAVAGLRRTPTADLIYPDETFRADAGLLPGTALIGTGSIVERLWTAPAVTVIGLDAPGVDVAANLLLASVRAKVSVRLAPDQTWQEGFEAVRAHLEANVPWGCTLDVDLEDHGNGFVAPTTGAYVEAARASFADAWGVAPVDTGIGGSIPFISEFAAAFPDAAILVTGVEDPDTRAHGADESLHLGEFERVCLAETLLLERVGRLTSTARD